MTFWLDNMVQQALVQGSCAFVHDCARAPIQYVVLACLCECTWGKLYPTLELQLSNQGPESKQCTARGPCLSNLQLHS